MKQILFVLAILISGIASAQSTWVTSVCNGEIVHNSNNYMIIDDILTTNLQGNIPGEGNPGGYFCLDDAITNTTLLSNGREAFNRYFRWYHHSESRSNSGDNYSVPGEITTYRFENHPNEDYRSIRIRIYPGNYADGQTYFQGLIEERRLGLTERQEWQNQFEVMTGAHGRSLLNDTRRANPDDGAPERFHLSAQEAWEYAITH